MQNEASKNQSRFKLLIAGIIAGLLSGVVKLGWEVMFPPRTPSRDATNPPQQLLQLLEYRQILPISHTIFLSMHYLG